MKRKAKTVEKCWVRIVQDDRWGPIIIKRDADRISVEEINACLRDLNAKHPDSPSSLYVSIDPIPVEMAKALDLCEWEKEQSMEFCKEILRQIGLGNYNDKLKDMAIKVIEYEHDKDDAKSIKAIEQLKALPSRTVCGGIEMWCEAAFSTFAFQRMGQLESKRKIMEQIEALFAIKAVPA